MANAVWAYEGLEDAALAISGAGGGQTMMLRLYINSPVQDPARVLADYSAFVGAGYADIPLWAVGPPVPVTAGGMVTYDHGNRSFVIDPASASGIVGCVLYNQSTGKVYADQRFPVIQSPALLGGVLVVDPSLFLRGIP